MDLTWLSTQLVALAVVSCSFFTLTSQRALSDWETLHISSPCPSGVTTHVPPSMTTPHQIARTLLTHVNDLREEAHKLEKHYCTHRYDQEFCLEAEGQVTAYFKPTELVATPSGVSQEAITARAKEVYSKLVVVHMQFETTILREKDVPDPISLEEEFTGLKTRTQILRCYIKRYIEAQGQQVIVNAKPDEEEVPAFPKTSAGQILADIFALNRLKHLLNSLHRDFRHAHPHKTI